MYTLLCHVLYIYILLPKPICRHLKKLTCNGSLLQVFIRVYRLKIQLIMLVFRPSFVNYCREVPLQLIFFRWRHFALLSFSLIFLRPWPFLSQNSPPPHTLVTYLRYCSTYTLFIKSCWGSVMLVRVFMMMKHVNVSCFRSVKPNTRCFERNVAEFRDLSDTQKRRADGTWWLHG
jgi:hypothetical protein